MGNRLLLADDSITIQKVVAIIFANEEFELTVVDNGNAALDKAREIQPDLMLVDALMPGKTGYEVCAEIRRDPRLSATPLLLLIGAFEPVDEEKERSCGADASISKPFESQQLIDKVKELLEVGKARKAAPAPVAAAPEPAGAAEDIWGDLSSLDTMSSFAEPAAVKAPPAAAVREPAPAPVQPAAAPSYAAPAVPEYQEEIVEASMEDDLWGAFDLEEEAPAGGFGVIEPGGDFEAEQIFSFEEEDEAVLETGAAVELVEEPALEASAEELFVLEETPYGDYDAELVAEVETTQEAVFELPEYEPVSLQEVMEAAPIAAFDAAPAFEAAPAAPAFEAAAPIPPIEPQAAPAVAPAAAATAAPAAAVSEEAIVAALSNLSRDVIERIVWEVVPDLAEVLIKEEIKKLKEGIRG